MFGHYAARVVLFMKALQPLVGIFRIIPNRNPLHNTGQNPCADRQRAQIAASQFRAVAKSARYESGSLHASIRTETLAPCRYSQIHFVEGLTLGLKFPSIFLPSLYVTTNFPEIDFMRPR